ncbi:hypothetical protein GCM10027589_35030 [Actinocorallia lasiicapitis]
MKTRLIDMRVAERTARCELVQAAPGRQSALGAERVDPPTADTAAKALSQMNEEYTDEIVDRPLGRPLRVGNTRPSRPQHHETVPPSARTPIRALERRVVRASADQSECLGLVSPGPTPGRSNGWKG